MMKRILCLMTALILALAFSGCSDNSQQLRQPVRFYYCNSNITYASASGVISCEVRESAGYEDDLQELLDLYLSGTGSDELYSPFPAGCAVISIQEDTQNITVMLSSQFAELSGLDLSLACTCLSMTVLDLTDSSTVTICAQEALLDGKQSITMSRDSLLLLDDSSVQIP